MTDNMIGDRYVLGPLLGRGGMAEVRRARDLRLERDVAVKRLKADLAGDPIFQERFRREAHAAAGLNHPNIVSVFDTGESYDEASDLMIPYIVMELVVGHTLREILHDGRKIQPVKALELTECVLDALDYSHRHGIIHRDIKPANVMLTNTGQVKVMDFGIARAVSDTAASMTQTASVIGTPQYLSPEQIRGEKVDRRSDIYSTGCLLYELLTGKPPFEGDSPVSLAYQHVKATPVPPSQIDPLVSTQMDAIVLKALAKNPNDRYQTAQEMRDDIARLLAGQKVQAQVPPPVEEDDMPTMALPNEDKTQVMPGRSAAKQPARALTTEEDEEPPSNLGKIIAIVVGIMLVIAIGAAGLVWYFANKGEDNPLPVVTSNGQVAVPSVTTMNQQAATQALEKRGLTAVVQTWNGPDDTSVNTVTDQTPSDGTMVAVGSSVTIKINIGPEKFQIPDVTKMSEADARTALAKVPFTHVISVAADEESVGMDPGTVVKTDPAPGGMATKDQQITLYLATGEVTLPYELIGMTRDDALRKLGSLGLEGEVSYEYQVSTDPDVAPDTVINVKPATGTPVTKDTPITLVLAEAPYSPPPPESPSATSSSASPSATPS